MKHIVLAEDDPWLGELYLSVLRGASYTVDWQRDAPGALDAIDDHRPDVLVLDMWLPQVNGIQLLQEIQSHSDLAQLTIVLCSSNLPKFLTPEVLKAYGVAATIDKTASNPAHFLQTIQQAITHHANVPH